MNFINFLGSVIIALAFLCYSIGSFSLIRFKSLSVMLLIIMSSGLVFETIALISLFSIKDSLTEFKYIYYHIFPIFGYALMFIKVGWLWQFYLSGGLKAKISKSYLVYNKISWFLWSIYYLTGTFYMLWIIQ